MPAKKEKDLSYPYMQEGVHGSMITLIGGQQITDPVYCIGCKLPHPIDEEVEMNLSQALEHFLLHNDQGHSFYHQGYQALMNNEDRYRKIMVRRAQKIEESTKAARLKKVLA